MESVESIDFAELAGGNQIKYQPRAGNWQPDRRVPGSPFPRCASEPEKRRAGESESLPADR